MWHHACPLCENETSYIQLKHGKKTIYTRHRRFLKHYHPYRQLKKAFNGSQEYGSALKPLAIKEVYHRVKDILTIFGKTQKKDASEKNIWKKRSIFFDLPYWFDLDVRHCIDLMHVKKNVCDSLIIAPFLTLKARQRMVWSVIKTWLTWVYESSCIQYHKVGERICPQHVTQCQQKRR